MSTITPRSSKRWIPITLVVLLGSILCSAVGLLLFLFISHYLTISDAIVQPMQLGIVAYMISLIVKSMICILYILFSYYFVRAILKDLFRGVTHIQQYLENGKTN